MVYLLQNVTYIGPTCFDEQGVIIIRDILTLEYKEHLSGLAYIKFLITSLFNVKRHAGMFLVL
jgi:hypothetical protein